MIIIIPNENSLSYSSLKSNSTNWPNKFIPAFKSKHAQAEEKSLAGEYSVTRLFAVRCAWTILWSRTVYARAHPILTAHNVCIYVYVCMYVCISLSLSRSCHRALALSLSCYYSIILHLFADFDCRFSALRNPVRYPRLPWRRSWSNISWCIPTALLRNYFVQGTLYFTSVTVRFGVTTRSG